MRAGDDANQRRFAGPIFTDERMHFAALKVKRYAFERMHGPERLVDVAKFEQANHAFVPRQL